MEYHEFHIKTKNIMKIKKTFKNTDKQHWNITIILNLKVWMCLTLKENLGSNRFSIVFNFIPKPCHFK